MPEISEVELKKIRPNSLNPRLEINKTGIDELADSIIQVGLLEPIIVRKIGNDSYEVVVGERRYWAAQKAGMKSVPVIVREYTDEQVMKLNLIENIQREDLNAVEKGKLCKLMMERFPEQFPTQLSVSQKLGVHRKRVEEWLAMTSSPENVQNLVAPRDETGRIPKGKISYDVALKLQQSNIEPEKQIELAKRFAERPTPNRAYRQIIKETQLKPEKPIAQVFHEVINEAPIYLPFSKVHADAIVNKQKTQTARKAKDPRLLKGAIVRAQVTHFADLEVDEVYRKKLGEFDDEDAEREGGYTLEEFKHIWEQLHGEWNPSETVYVIKFRLARLAGDTNSLE